MDFTKITLDNGLPVLVHRDPSSPMVALNLLYRVGARDEDPGRTGFAHLFEHLMFGGSANIPDFDIPLQHAGGENNAFTNNDITNYYLSLPPQNLETGFWLESDRMNELDFSGESLEIQKKVVIEEFRQRYLNQPYGDAWLLMRPLAYQVHPYRWATIGMDVSHIAGASLEEVKSFFFSHYAPNNAILSLAGNISPDEAFRLAEKWFGPIPSRQIRQRNLPEEPPQEEYRYQEVERKVPYPAIYLAYHMGSRTSRSFYVNDLISDVLSSGMSSRFLLNLIKGRRLFSDLDAYITGDRDPGLFIISGRLADGVTPEEGLAGINEEIVKIISEAVTERELEKVLNRMESHLLFSRINILNQAMNLAYYEWLGDASMMAAEMDLYRSVTRAEIQAEAGRIFTAGNCSCLVIQPEGGRK
ncbi:MAG: pitrilysin family protein [Bacteroidales bacterium]